MIDLKQIRDAVVLIGYYAPFDKPIFLGTGFLVGNGDRAMTCAHVVITTDENSSQDPCSFPLMMAINGKYRQLSCWAIRFRENVLHFIHLPIMEIVALIDINIESFYLGSYPDVAYLHLDLTEWYEKFPHEKPPTLEVSDQVLRTLGAEVAIIGYPSPEKLMFDSKTDKIRCTQPLTQFARLAGILPNLEARMPEFLVFDTLFAKGSSGSPIIDLSTGKVVAITAQLLPFYFYEGVYVPSSFGFGVASNFFYEMSKSKDGKGIFNFNYP
jgi:hypothetical protein